MSNIDPAFTSPDERRNYWPMLRLLLIGAVLILGGRWVMHNYPVPFLDQTIYLESRQADNDRVIEFYTEALQTHREETGSFPLNLVDALRPTRVPGGIGRGIPPRDAWDHRLRYFSDGEMFLLVSVGRDGESETEEYHELRQKNSRRDVCDEPDADLVASDRGWHQRCEASD